MCYINADFCSDDNMTSVVLLLQKWVVVTPADTTRGEQEPVHEDSPAVVGGVVGQQSVPLVSLLTAAVSATSGCGLLTEHKTSDTTV